MFVFSFRVSTTALEIGRFFYVSKKNNKKRYIKLVCIKFYTYL